jgi:hypothetical protein
LRIWRRWQMDGEEEEEEKENKEEEDIQREQQ